MAEPRNLFLSPDGMAGQFLGMGTALSAADQQAAQEEQSAHFDGNPHFSFSGIQFELKIWIWIKNKKGEDSPVDWAAQT